METIQELTVLTEAECQAVRATVYDLQSAWLRRNPMVPFFTLGAASYLDAASHPENYYATAKHSNPVLQEQFSWLYERVALVLSQQLQAPVNYQHAFALPGFHVYLSSKVFEQPIASIHCDLQYQLLDWRFASNPDLTQPLSFTLAISLPRHGGGLNVWDLHYHDIIDVNRETMLQRVRSQPQQFHPYQVGTLILHSGHTIHQAAPARDVQPDDDRITLQGHCLFSQGQWHLYW